MDKTGFVKSIDGKDAIIEVVRPGACGDSCSTCKSGCESQTLYIRVNNNANVSVGQLVKLHSDSKIVMKSVLLLYMMPLLLMILGIAIGMVGAEYFGYNDLKELIAVGVGVIALLLSYMLLGYIDKRIKNNKEMEIIISDVIN